MAANGYRTTMVNALPLFRLPRAADWRDLVLPREHGSWSLALEPLALALLVVPSVPGAALAVAVVAAFFARRPLRIALRETQLDRRNAAHGVLGMLALIAALATALAVAVGGFRWAAWLVPSLIGGAVFLGFDLRSGGREEVAEIAGSAAFAWLPAAFAVLADATPEMALALGLVMCGRAVPTVMTVRAALRAAKTGGHRTGPALGAALVALAAGIALALMGHAPWLAAGALALLAARTFWLLILPAPALRARTIGISEAILGIIFVVTLAAVWRL